MILHIIGQTMYTTDFYHFINDNYDAMDHCFATGHAKNKDAIAPIGIISSSQDVKIIAPKNIIKYLSAINNADGIVFHGIFSFKHLLLISLRRNWLKKVCWIVWGGDIYCFTKENKRLKEKLTDFLKVRCCRDFKIIAPLVEKDYQFAKEWFGVTAPCCCVSYPIPLQRKDTLKKIVDKGVSKSNFENRSVKIVLGNSATETNCHFDALDKLAVFKDENICIYLPLSYGFSGYETYAQSVIDYANEIFGKDRIIPILDKMDGIAYTELLSDMDIAIFNNNRQQAMGNIAILLAAGTKIFIRDDTSMWSHYIKRGYELENFSNFNFHNFEDFCQYDSDRKVLNMSLIQNYLSNDVLKSKWDKLFSLMMER